MKMPIVELHTIGARSRRYSRACRREGHDDQGHQNAYHAAGAALVREHLIQGITDGMYRT